MQVRTIAKDAAAGAEGGSLKYRQPSPPAPLVHQQVYQILASMSGRLSPHHSAGFHINNLWAHPEVWVTKLVGISSYQVSQTLHKEIF